MSCNSIFTPSLSPTVWNHLEVSDRLHGSGVDLQLIFAQCSFQELLVCEFKSHLLESSHSHRGLKLLQGSPHRTAKRGISSVYFNFKTWMLFFDTSVPSFTWRRQHFPPGTQPGCTAVVPAPLLSQHHHTRCLRCAWQRPTVSIKDPKPCCTLSQNVCLCRNSEWRDYLSVHMKSVIAVMVIR